MSHDVGLELLCQQLGVPLAVLSGDSNYAGLSAEFVRRENVRIDELRQDMTTKVVAPLLEKNFPELFWELAFMMSPGIKVYRRRKPPTIKWEW